MANFTKVGIDLDNLANPDPLNISFSTNIKQFLADIPVKANELTNGYIGAMVSTTMFFFMLWLLCDKTVYADFRYSYIRGTGIASCIVSMLGIMFLALGFFTEYYHIVVFMVIAGICTTWVFIEE